MHEITIKLTDREVVLLTALLGRTTGRDLYYLFDKVRDITEMNKELAEKYREAYDVLGEMYGDIEIAIVTREVFGV